VHEVTVPGSAYDYVVTSTLPDGRTACGTVRAQSLAAPPITGLTARYIAANNVESSFTLPPFVHEVIVYQANGIRAATLNAPNQHYVGRESRQITALHVDPGQASSADQYALTVEAVWTAATSNGIDCQSMTTSHAAVPHAVSRGAARRASIVNLA
jgi:hypothetical protein